MLSCFVASNAISLVSLALLIRELAHAFVHALSRSRSLPNVSTRESGSDFVYSSTEHKQSQQKVLIEKIYAFLIANV